MGDKNPKNIMKKKKKKNMAKKNDTDIIIQ